MQADRPAVLLAYAHSSRKKRGIQEVKALTTDLSGDLKEDAIWIREGQKSGPWASEVFSSGLTRKDIAGIHLLVENGETGEWWLNDYAGRKKKLDWETVSLDGHPSLTWIWIHGEDAPDKMEKLLFAGAPVVITGGVSLAVRWFEHLKKGHTIREAWNLLETPLPIHSILSDPFEYWEWCENRNEDHIGSAMMVLSNNESVLDKTLFAPDESSPAVVIDPHVEEQPSRVLIPEFEPVLTEVESFRFSTGARSLEQARREELEYRHPIEVQEPEFSLALKEDEWEEWEVSEERIIEIINKEDVRFAPRRRILATAVSTCLGIALLMVGLWQMGWKLSDDQLDRMAHFSTFSDSSGFRVLLLPFHPESGCTPSEIWDEMAVRDHLMSRPEAEELGLEVTYITPGSCPEREEDARRLAEIYQADVLIWGDPTSADSSVLQLKYVLGNGSADLQLDKLLQHHHLAEGLLGGANEVVVDQILAIGFAAHSQPREALTYLDSEAEVPVPVAAWRELASILSLEELHQPEKALERCEAALEIHEADEHLSFHATRLRDIVYPSTSDEAAPDLEAASLSEGIAIR